MALEIRSSALKHGVSAESIIHAVSHPLYIDEDFRGTEPAQVLMLGPDVAGNMLEVVGRLDVDEAGRVPRHGGTTIASQTREPERRDMKETMRVRISDEPVTMANGEVLTEADFERMALEAETTEIDVDRLLDRQRRGVGRPSISERGGRSGVLQVRLDDETRQQLTQRADQEHTTPSSIARDAIRAWLTAS